MKAQSILLASLLMVCASCRTYTPATSERLSDSDFRRHVLMFDSRGEPRDPLGSHPYLLAEHTPATGDSAGITYTGYIDEILRGIEEHRSQQADGRAHIVFFFHGGLNSRNVALERARVQMIAMRKPKQEGGNPSIYPIFVNWQTSLYASYRDHLLYVTKGQDTYAPGAALWPFKLAADLGRFALEVLPDNGLAAWDLRRHWTYVREGAVQSTGCPLNQLDFRQGTAAVRTRTARIMDKSMALTTYFIAKWWMTGIIDAGGTPAWSSMIYTADRLFYSDQEMHHDYHYEEAETSGAGDFSHFLRVLSTKVAPHDDIVLVAHSAGAIVANIVLQHFADRLPIKTLVYLAPACTTAELMRGGRIANFLAADPSRELYVLTLHEISELSERHLADLTPRGSLLVWLDQFIQVKSSEFGGRMMGRAKNLRLLAHLIPCTIQQQIHITAFAQGEESSTMFRPQTHSAISEVKYWQGADAWRPRDDALLPICFTTNPQTLRDRETAGLTPPECSAAPPRTARAERRRLKASGGQ